MLQSVMKSDESLTESQRAKEEVERKKREMEQRLELEQEARMEMEAKQEEMMRAKQQEMDALVSDHKKEFEAETRQVAVYLLNKYFLLVDIYLKTQPNLGLNKLQKVQMGSNKCWAQCLV